MYTCQEPECSRAVAGVAGKHALCFLHLHVVDVHKNKKRRRSRRDEPIVKVFSRPQDQVDELEAALKTTGEDIKAFLTKATESSATSVFPTSASSVAETTRKKAPTIVFPETFVGSRKAAQLLADAMWTPTFDGSELALGVARLEGNPQRLRKLLFALKSNAELKKRITNGELNAESFCALDDAALERPERRRLREENVAEMMASKMRVQGDESEITDKVCPRCGGTSCSFFQFNAARDSHKAETWGNKNKVELMRITCRNPNCGHSWFVED